MNPVAATTTAEKPGQQRVPRHHSTGLQWVSIANPFHYRSVAIGEFLKDVQPIPLKWLPIHCEKTLARRSILVIKPNMSWFPLRELLKKMTLMIPLVLDLFRILRKSKWSHLWSKIDVLCPWDPRGLKLGKRSIGVRRDVLGLGGWVAWKTHIEHTPTCAWCVINTGRLHGRWIVNLLMQNWKQFYKLEGISTGTSRFGLCPHTLEVWLSGMGECVNTAFLWFWQARANSNAQKPLLNIRPLLRFSSLIWSVHRSHCRHDLVLGVVPAVPRWTCLSHRKGNSEAPHRKQIRQWKTIRSVMSSVFSLWLIVKEEEWGCRITSPMAPNGNQTDLPSPYRKDKMWALRMSSDTCTNRRDDPS